MECYLLHFSLLFTLFVHVFALTQRAPREVCLLPVEEGPCDDSIQRYYYNTLTQQCEEFSYGGCLGNANNFKTFEECQKTCWKIPKIPRICRLGKDVGPCRAIYKRYFFNMTSMRCEEFEYGGCNGNNNRFGDMVSCKEYCEPRKRIPALCVGRLDKGACSASIPRYYYNEATRSCEEFSYTGCGGNGNNFNTRESCAEVCVKGRKDFKSSLTQGKIRRKNRYSGPRN